MKLLIPLGRQRGQGPPPWLQSAASAARALELDPGSGGAFHDLRRQLTTVQILPHHQWGIALQRV